MSWIQDSFPANHASCQMRTYFLRHSTDVHASPLLECPFSVHIWILMQAFSHKTEHVCTQNHAESDGSVGSELTAPTLRKPVRSFSGLLFGNMHTGRGETLWPSSYKVIGVLFYTQRKECYAEYPTRLKTRTQLLVLHAEFGCLGLCLQRLPCVLAL